MQPITKGQKAKHDGMILTDDEYKNYQKLRESLREYLTQRTIYDTIYHV